MEETVGRLELRLAGADLRVSGPVRVTTTDTLMASLLPDIIAAMKAAHPGIEVELTTSNLLVDLTRREADVAIRPADDPPQTLFGRRISAIGFALYARRADERRPAGAAKLAERLWIAQHPVGEDRREVLVGRRDEGNVGNRRPSFARAECERAAPMH